MTHAILRSEGKVPAYRTVSKHETAAARKVLGLDSAFRNVAMMGVVMNI